jgi:hypothetical protein
MNSYKLSKKIGNKTFCGSIDLEIESPSDENMLTITHNELFVEQECHIAIEFGIRYFL